MTLDVHRVPSTTGQFDSGISQHVEVSKSASLVPRANQRHSRENNNIETNTKRERYETENFSVWCKSG